MRQDIQMAGQNAEVDGKVKAEDFAIQHHFATDSPRGAKGHMTGGHELQAGILLMASERVVENPPQGFGRVAVGAAA